MILFLWVCPLMCPSTGAFYSNHFGSQSVQYYYASIASLGELPQDLKLLGALQSAAACWRHRGSCHQACPHVFLARVCRADGVRCDRCVFAHGVLGARALGVATVAATSSGSVCPKQFRRRGRSGRTTWAQKEE